MKKHDLISVIVPVYQVEQYLRQCVDSILLQTYEDLEVILVDDGSYDSCPQICDEYAKKDSRVSVIHKVNGGLVSARQAGLPRAHGNLIAYVDSDDWLEPEMYEKLHEILSKNRADAVVCGHYEENGVSTKVCTNYIHEGVYRGDELKSRVFSKMLYVNDIEMWGLSPACWDKLFRRELIYDEQMSVDPRIWDGEDHAFIYPSLVKAKCICISDEAFYHHRIRENSVATGYDNRAFERFSYLYNSLKNKFEQSEFWTDCLANQFTYQMRWFLVQHMYSELGIDYYKSSNLIKNYIFPFNLIEKGSKIILYGAGEVGDIYFRQITAIKYCTVVAWIAEKASEEYKDIVAEPKEENIHDLDYDYVVIAVMKKDTYKSIMQNLETMGISQDKVIWQQVRA